MKTFTKGPQVTITVALEQRSASQHISKRVTVQRRSRSPMFTDIWIPISEQYQQRVTLYRTAAAERSLSMLECHGWSK